MRQQYGEKIAAFFTRMRGAVLNSTFTAVDGTKNNHFTDKMVSMVLLEGLADKKILKEILRKKDVNE